MNDNFGFAQVVPDPLKISLKPFEAKSENGKKDKQAKKDLAADLHSHIVSGSIANRNQLIGYMKKKGLHIALIGDEFITVRLPGADKNTRLKGPLFSKDSDYAALVEEHHRSKIPKYLTPAEAADQRTKLVDFIAARTVFNQRRYLTLDLVLNVSRSSPAGLQVASGRVAGTRSQPPLSMTPPRSAPSLKEAQGGQGPYQGGSAWPAAHQQHRTPPCSPCPAGT